MIESIPQFEKDDFHIGGFLGVGNFCSVHDAVISPKYLKKSSANAENSHSKLEKPFALKIIKGPNHQDDQPNFAYMDLVRETALLSSLNHENIISIYGRGRRTPDCTLKNQYFIVLEKLSCTLEKKIQIWSTTPEIDDMRNVTQNTFRNRLEVAASIASAVSYLHSQDIVFRDLKPANIGFNFQGEVKLFDLGFALQLQPGVTLKDFIGSPRYMAPEVFQRCEYGLSVDVYSFGILLWEICCLKKPFGDISAKALKHKKMEGGRPKIDPHWSESLQDLISFCWDSDPLIRPSMKSVEDALRREVKKGEDFYPKRRNSLFHKVKRRCSI